MGLFRKKKRMVDIRELHRRGVVAVPRNVANSEVITDDQGFVELGNKSMGVVGGEVIPTLDSPRSSSEDSSSAGGGDFFNFMDSGSSLSGSSSSGLSSATTPSEDLRKISAQLSELDNKLYKMEQRIELLERKLDVDSGGSSSVGVAGW